MAAPEHRRAMNQGYTVSEHDRLFGESIRRLLLRIVALIEDRYGLEPFNRKERSVTTR